MTDGFHNHGKDRESIIELAYSKEVVVHTLGIGNSVDVDLLQKTAVAGRGSFNLIEDGAGGSVLNKKVIAALQKALEPALEKCSIHWGSEKVDLGTVFRN